MTYATQQDLVDRFGADELIELTDRVNAPPAVIQVSVVAKALADADELINGYLATRYTLPLSPVPEMVKRLACDIARFFLHASAPTDAVQGNYDDALARLRDIAKGTIQLQTAGIEPPSGSGDAPLVDAGERTFSRGTLADFQ